MKAILIDDELLSLRGLEKMLVRYCEDIEVVGSYQDPEKGRAAILDIKPQLVFLDVEMPGMNGFDLLDSLDDIRFDVIFTTAYDEYALKAIKFSAMDYLLKPIDEEELMRSVAKVKQKQSHFISPQHMDLLLTNLKSGDQFPKLAIPSLDGIEFVEVESIVHCDAERNYTIIYTQDGSQYVFSKTLKEIEKLLPERDFFRIHQSHLVNLRYIKKYIRGVGGEIVLQNGRQIKVAKARKEALMDRIFKK